MRNATAWLNHHSKRRIPEAFPTMAEALGEVCALPRRLL
jgi:hypothetical protein